MSKTHEMLLAYRSELDGMVKAGRTLSEIAKWSFEARSAGRNVPYMAHFQSDTEGVCELIASPIASQKELKAYFSEKAPGSVLPRFMLIVDVTGAKLIERLGRGKGNVKELS